MKLLLLILLGGLALSFAAQAASFDCGKATTKVEKLICADVELSKLDEELAAAYKTALQDETQADTVRQAQKQWLKKRNTCSDAICVRGIYDNRLHEILNDSAIKKRLAGKSFSSIFSGQWHIKLCDKNISKVCGGFTVYLIQMGKKICGDHFFATPGGGRLNEGVPRSIIGSVAENNVANIVITSGRNGAVFRVRAIENGDNMNWQVIEEIKHGSEDAALVLDKGNLRREMTDINYQAAIAACQSH